MPNVACCKPCDYVGCVKEGGARRCLLASDLILMVMSLLFSIVGALGVADIEDVVRNAPWAKISVYDDYSLYVNLWGIVWGLGTEHNGPDDVSCEQSVRTGRGMVTIDLCSGMSWGDLEEQQVEVLGYTNNTFFADCKDAATGCTSTAIMGVVTSLLAILSRCVCNSRFSFEKDSGKKRACAWEGGLPLAARHPVSGLASPNGQCIVTITTLLPIVTSLAAVAEFQDACVSAINDGLDDAYEAIGVEADVKVGGGFVCLILSFVCNALAFCLQLSVLGNTAKKQRAETTISATKA